MEFQVKYAALFCLLSVIDSFAWFWMAWKSWKLHGGSLDKNIQLMLEFVKAPFMDQHFSCSILLTFLMMLSALLLSMLMILFSTLSVIQIKLASELESDLRDTVDWDRKWSDDFNAEKTQLVLFD